MEEATSQSSNTAAQIVVRPVRPEERARGQAHHYLGFRPIVGQSLWYVATLQDQWVAVLGWGAAALKCGPRDALGSAGRPRFDCAACL